MQKVTEIAVRYKIDISEANVYIVGEVMSIPYIVAEKSQSTFLSFFLSFFDVDHCHSLH